MADGRCPGGLLVLVCVVVLVVPAFSVSCNSWPNPGHRPTKRNDAFVLGPVGPSNPSRFQPGSLSTWHLSGSRPLHSYEVVLITEPAECGGGLLPMPAEDGFVATECKNKLSSPSATTTTRQAQFQMMAPFCGCFSLGALVSDEEGRSYSYYSEPEHRLLTNTCPPAPSSTTSTHTRDQFLPAIQMDENENLMEEPKDINSQQERSYHGFLQRKKSYEQNRRKWRRRQELISKFPSTMASDTDTTFEWDTTAAPSTEAPAVDNLLQGSRLETILENRKERREFCCRLGRRSAAGLGETKHPPTKICSKLMHLVLEKLTKSQQRQCTVPFKRCCTHALSREVLEEQQML